MVDDILLRVRVNREEVATIRLDDLPCELERDIALDGPATIEFADADTCHVHHVPAESGWLHLNVRVHAGLACQADAVVTQHREHRAGAPIGDGEIGVRFQPFFLAGATNPPSLKGKGLFARGLHFAGAITPGGILLSCECDECARTFLVTSIHAGMADLAYFYSGSGRYTLLVDGSVDGAPTPLAQPDEAALDALERRLPPAPDDTRFAYLNPFRCPHCAAPYIDFAAHPGQREGEYYCLWFPDTPALRFEPDARADVDASLG